MRRYQHIALCDSVKLLAQDCMLVVFPEGYPNIDPHYTPKTRPEEFLPFKSGFAAIAAAARNVQEARIPIVPSGFRYTKNNRWTTGLNIGEAVCLEDFASRQLLLSYIEQRVAEVSGLSTAGQS
jgi:Acyltransferase